VCRSKAEGGRRCQGWSCTRANQRARKQVSRIRRALGWAEAAGNAAEITRLQAKLESALEVVKGASPGRR
jgi:hypothetical protein